MNWDGYIMLALNLPRSANINMKNKSNINTSRIGFKDFKISRISLSIEIITYFINYHRHYYSQVWALKYLAYTFELHP